MAKFQTELISAIATYHWPREWSGPRPILRTHTHTHTHTHKHTHTHRHGYVTDTNVCTRIHALLRLFPHRVCGGEHRCHTLTYTYICITSSAATRSHTRTYASPPALPHAHIHVHMHHLQARAFPLPSAPDPVGLQPPRFALPLHPAPSQQKVPSPSLPLHRPALTICCTCSQPNRHRCNRALFPPASSSQSALPWIQHSLPPSCRWRCPFSPSPCPFSNICCLLPYLSPYLYNIGGNLFTIAHFCIFGYLSPS